MKCEYNTLLKRSPGLKELKRQKQGSTTGNPRPGPPTFGEAARFWIKLGFINFGGPTGQIAIMQTELGSNLKIRRYKEKESNWQGQ